MSARRRLISRSLTHPAPPLYTSFRASRPLRPQKLCLPSGSRFRRATVFDLESTAEIGREMVEREAMSGRIEFRVGDFLKDDFDTGYAAALYFNILHNFSEKDNRRVLEKAFNALNPGGLLAIWDMFKH